MKYKIYASLKEDINEGICWVNNPKLSSRSVIRIFNKDTNKQVFCEAFRMDDNFVKHYNERKHTFKIVSTQNKNVIVLSEWYRVRLGDIDTQSEYDLEIKPYKYFGRFCASIQHPQIVVRYATWLATISVGLGILGFFLGVWSICLSLKQPVNLQQSTPQPTIQSIPLTNSANRSANAEHNP
jgi:hypothetical protein